MESWHHGIFMKDILLLILKKFLDTLINALWNGHKIVQHLKVINLQTITHAATFLKYVWKVKVIPEDVLIKLFICSLPLKLRDWCKHCCKPKDISSLTDLIEKFLEHWGPRSQTYEDTLQDFMAALQEEETFEEDEEICEEQERCEDFSQRLKESVREDKKFCKQLVDHCKDVHLVG
jgi:hypothetical protein